MRRRGRHVHRATHDAAYTGYQTRQRCGGSLGQGSTQEAALDAKCWFHFTRVGSGGYDVVDLVARLPPGTGTATTAGFLDVRKMAIVDVEEDWLMELVSRFLRVTLAWRSRSFTWNSVFPQHYVPG